ncbi:hypothetical protein [Entomohabitans teleogrylli]|uniref:hypothetical protein n=1 Tax=Entomohabitans teleogrylli TaxID=1384589 RepID=UPI000A738433|nr:hypothetical protein [Entomohabitans teleogrylli]
MKPIFMLLMIYISCTLYDYPTPVIVFFVLITALWLGVFKYVLYETSRKSNLLNLTDGRGAKDMVIVFICCMVNPVFCLISILLYQPYILSKRLQLYPKVKGRIKGGSGHNLRHSKFKSSSFDSGSPNFNSDMRGAGNDKILSFPTVNIPGSENYESHDTHAFDTTYDSGSEVYFCNESNFNNSSCDINPASGLPMTGGVDVYGDPFGVNSHDSY